LIAGETLGFTSIISFIALIGIEIKTRCFWLASQPIKGGRIGA
jgi:hypothetical protein